MSRKHHNLAEQGFSLIEVIIVVTLLAFVYTVALPQLSLRTGAAVANKLNQLASDIRSAYDLSVLSGKTYRIVFEFASGSYRLEEADRSITFLGDADLDRDPTAEEEKENQLIFENDFEGYIDLAGQTVIDVDNDREISPSSPVVEAKKRLRPPVWQPVKSLEWGKKSLGPELIIMDMQTEHHSRKQDSIELGREARGFLYFFPNGYVERAVLHIGYRKGDYEVDEQEKPYTIKTNPFEGTATIIPEYEEIDVLRDEAI